MFSLVSPMLAYQLKKVPAIKYGDAKENPDREAVPVEAVQYALAYFPATIADMLRLQLLTAMRPSEIRLMLVGYIRQKYDGENWLYLPPAHKTAWRGKKKAIVLGVEEQEILRKYIQDKPSDKPIFLNSRGNPYTASRYSTIVRKTIAKYDLVKFIPYQLRHTSLTQISVEHGKDAARAVAGHSSEVVTSIYDHSDVQKAQKVVNARNARYRQVGSVQVGSVQELPVVPFLRIFKGGDQL
ncbi:MAG: site-specific integrase [Planctomycetaceae bacterium]|nr:site-specific integrase [Planctomycetaceae bacterium]